MKFPIKCRDAIYRVSTRQGNGFGIETMTQSKFQGKYRIESTRLSDRNYAANGSYFITICTRDRIHFFGDVIAGEMLFSPIGEIAQRFWTDIPNHFDFAYIDTYVIMPNHVYGIVVIDRPPDVETRYIASLQPTDESNKFGSLKSGSLQSIIHSYKSAVTRWCHKNGYDHFCWQSRFL